MANPKKKTALRIESEKQSQKMQWDTVTQIMKLFTF